MAEISYGAIANIPLFLQRIGYDRRGLYVGTNGLGEQVILNRTLRGIRAITGDRCKIVEFYNEDNIPFIEPDFDIANSRIKELTKAEEELSEGIMRRLML